MTHRYNATLRTAWAASKLAELGAGHKVKFYDGTQPGSVATAISGPTLLGVLTADATPGDASTPVLAFDTANYTQDNSLHVNGTPTWVSFTKADDTRVWEFAVSGDGMTFTGTIQNGVDISPDAWTWTAPGA